MRSAMIVLVVLGMTLAISAAAQHRSLIRFYTVNDRGQESLIKLVLNTDEPGCHAFPISRKVHRVAVIGFEYCAVFATRDCEAGSEVSAMWKKKPDETNTRFHPGSQWYLDPEGEVEISAWRCEG
jgi:hypothetical protein